MIRIKVVNVYSINENDKIVHMSGACPGGGPRGLPPPPLEIEKQKKGHQSKYANIKLFHLYFATFLVENIIFSASF